MFDNEVPELSSILLVKATEVEEIHLKTYYWMFATTAYPDILMSRLEQMQLTHVFGFQGVHFFWSMDVGGDAKLNNIFQAPCYSIKAT